MLIELNYLWFNLVQNVPSNCVDLIVTTTHFDLNSFLAQSATSARAASSFAASLG